MPQRRSLLPRMAVAAVLLHGLPLLAVLLAAQNRAAPPPAQPVQVELLQQQTLTGGGDRRIQGEGSPDQGVAVPDTPVMPAVGPAKAAPPAATAIPQNSPQDSRQDGKLPTPVPMPMPTPQTAAPDVSQPADTPAPPMPDEAGLSGEAGTGQVMGSAVIPASPETVASNAPPAYPPAARQHREQGQVALRIHVLADGRANGVFVIGSSGHAALDQAARAAVARWRFRPALNHGRPVASDLLFRFDFVLKPLTEALP